MKGDLILPDEVHMANNITFDGKGKVKHFGFKTMRGLIRELKLANKNLKKYGSKMQFQIVLPVKN